MKYLILFLLIFNKTLLCQKIITNNITFFQKVNLLDYYDRINLSYFENIFFEKDKILCFNQFECLIFKENNKAEKVDLLKTLTKKERRKVSNNYNNQYFYSNDTLLIKSNQHIYVYTKKVLDFKCLMKIKCEESVTNLYHNNGTIYCYGINNSSSSIKNEELIIFSYNIIKNQSNIYKKQFDYLPLCYFKPNSYIDFHQNIYLTCDPLNYKITFFDKENNCFDSIIPLNNVFDNEKENIKIFSDINFTEQMKKNPSSYFHLLNKKLDKTDRIWIVKFISKDKIFVRFSKNSSNNLNNSHIFIDHVWYKKNNNWELEIIKQDDNINFNENYNKNELWPYFITGTKIIFSENKINYLIWSQYENINPQTNSEFYGLSNKIREKIILKLIEFNF